MDWRDFDTRLAAYAVIVDDADRLLLALWNGPEIPRWTLPGGGVELGERPEEAAIREVREETGYTVRLCGFLGTDVEVIPPGERHAAVDRPLQAVRVVYRAEVTGGQLTDEVDGSTDEARWIPTTEIPGLLRVPLVDAGMALRRKADTRPRPRLVVLAGRPGTGKTTLARRLTTALGAAHLRVDTVETAVLDGGLDEPGVLGYRIVHDLAAESLAAGTPVVIDAVNPVPEARAGWRGLADRCGASAVFVETVLRDPTEHRARVESRQADIAGQRVPTWDEVRTSHYTPWDEERDGPRLLVDMTDTGAGVGEVLARLGTC